MKIRYVLLNKHTNVINLKVYTLIQIETEGLHGLFDLENYTILSRDRFTVLHDKNGKEIYEGDLIQTYQGECVEVKFCNGAFVWHEGDPLGFGIYNGEYGDNPVIISETTEDWCEVIGNIHQNPELLNK